MLYALVEGDDDERFIDAVIRPRFEEISGEGSLFVWQYAQKTKRQVRNIIKSLESMDAQFFFLCDQDLRPCITRTKEVICGKYVNVPSGTVIVAVSNIEEWHLAGLLPEDTRSIGIRGELPSTVITKDQFEDLIPKGYLSRTDFMVEILRRYSLEQAAQTNPSIRYLCERLGLGS